MADDVAEFLHLSHDPAVAPEEVLFPHPDHQVAQFPVEAWPARLLQLFATLHVVHPPPVSLRPDDPQDRHDLLAKLRPDPQKLGLLRRTWYNAFSGKPAAQDFDLRFEESNLRVVARSEELEEHPQDRLEGMAHG